MPNRYRLTPEQAETLSYLVEQVGQTGKMPRRADIAARFSLKTHTCAARLRVLQGCTACPKEPRSESAEATERRAHQGWRATSTHLIRSARTDRASRRALGADYPPEPDAPAHSAGKRYGALRAPKREVELSAELPDQRASFGTCGDPDESAVTVTVPAEGALRQRASTMRPASWLSERARAGGGVEHRDTDRRGAQEHAARLDGKRAHAREGEPFSSPSFPLIGCRAASRYAPGVNGREGWSGRRSGVREVGRRVAGGEDARVRALGVQVFESLHEVRGRCDRRRRGAGAIACQQIRRRRP